MNCNEPKIFKADPTKVEAYHLLGDEYDFSEDTEYVEGLVNKLREGRNNDGRDTGSKTG